MILFFDTETTGLPKNWNAPVTDLNNWPRMVQLAYIFCDNKGKVISKGDYLVKPNGYTIPSDSSKIHGISTERAILEGKDLTFILQEFNTFVDKAEYLVAHNISFDEKIVASEFLRIRMKSTILDKQKICTMVSTTDYCAIESPRGYKWPKLSELHYKLFKSNFEEAHNAAIDINATAKCFWELKKLGIIDINEDVNQSLLKPVTKEGKHTNPIGIDDLNQILNEHCIENNITEIPIEVKVQAIMEFEKKCKQIPHESLFDEEIIVFKNYWKNDDNTDQENSLNSIQKQFIFCIQCEIIEEYKLFDMFDKNKTIDEKVLQLKALILKNPINSKEYLDLVAFIYYYYLAKYYDYPPRFDFEKVIKEKLIAGFSSIARTALSNFEDLISDYNNILQNLFYKESNLTPESLYELILNCSNELLIIKTEVGIQNRLYQNASYKIFELSTRILADWVTKVLEHQNKFSHIIGKNPDPGVNILTIKNSGIKLGKSMLDSFIIIANEIEKIETDASKKIETDESTQDLFNEIKGILEKLSINAKAKSEGCYIATMAYGNYCHPQVLILRNFRDNYLIASNTGKIVVKFYYWLSPKLVKRFKNNNSINENVRVCLDFVIKYLIPR